MALSNRMVSTSAPQQGYHVFLSFRGTDTRAGFTINLYNKLKGRAVNAFMDDSDLERGTTINEELVRAIEQARYAIVIISKDYASSHWCLLELAYIVQRMKERGQIMPIFYEVDPGDVRHQTGVFAQHFTKHEKMFGEGSEKVLEWRKALTKLGTFAGLTLTDRSGETAVIKKIVYDVWEKILPTPRSVGLIYSRLNSDSNDIRFIGIWGRDEKGINTTAKLVYDKFSDNFEFRSFLKNIRKESKSKSLVYLQTQLLEQLHGRSIKVSDVYVGKILTKDCVRNKKVLRILDDVDQSDQIDSLAGEKNWYGAGSVIIITSMNRDLLKEHDIVEPYLLEGLNKDEASRYDSIQL